MVPQFPKMIAAELRKILTRPSGLAGLALSAVIPILAVLAMAWVKDMSGEASVNGSPLGQMVKVDAVTVGAWALAARNFFVLKMFMLMVSAQLLAGEWSDRTLRGLLLRPVPRWSVLAAKLAACQLYSAASLGLTLLIALVPAAGMFPMEEDLKGLLLAYLCSWGVDLAVVAIGLLLSTISPSVVGVVVGAILFLMADLAGRGALKAMGFFGVTWAEDVGKWMPGNALDAWEGWQGGWDPQALAGLAGLAAVCLGLALARFQRTEVP